MRIVVAILAVVVAGLGCDKVAGKKSGGTKSGGPPVDLVANIGAVRSEDFDPRSASIFGVKLGDPASAIPPTVKRASADALVWYHDGGYMLAVNAATGRVDTISISGKALAPLGIKDPLDIPAQFGTAASAGSHVWIYPSRWLAVSWGDGKLGEIRIEARND